MAKPKSVRRTVMKAKQVQAGPAALKRPGSIFSTKAAKTKRVAPAPLKRSQVPSALRQMNALVINLERRPDRWAGIQKSLTRRASWLKVDRLSAVDGKAAPPPKSEVTTSWTTGHLAELFDWYKAVKIQMSPGERGCSASHIAAWRAAAKAKGPTIVLEDDAVALPSFTETVAQAVKEAPKGTHMVFLSSKDRGRPKRAGKVLMTPDFIWTTVGYIIWPAGAKALLEMLPVDAPVDNFLGWHIREGRVKAYSVRPAAVRQAQTWNIGSDVPHSDDVAH